MPENPPQSSPSRPKLTRPKLARPNMAHLNLAHPATVRHPRSLAATARGADRWLGVYFMAVSGLLVAGWTLPIMTVHKLVFFAEEVSILAGARQLWDNGNPFLCVVVLTFSVAFPALKMLVALTLWYGADARGPDAYGVIGGSQVRFFQTVLLGPWISKFGSKKMGAAGAKPNAQASTAESSRLPNRLCSTERLIRRATNPSKRSHSPAIINATMA